MELPNNVFLPEVGRLIAEGHNVTITPKGNSMRPFVESGRDKVVLSKAGQLRVGDAVLAEISSGTFVLHRIIAIDGERLTLQGDGNLRGTERCRIADVLGVVTQYLYPGHSVSAADPSLCRRVRIWRQLRPVRRYLLYIYRKLILR